MTGQIVIYLTVSVPQAIWCVSLIYCLPVKLSIYLSVDFPQAGTVMHFLRIK